MCSITMRWDIQAHGVRRLESRLVFVQMQQKMLINNFYFISVLKKAIRKHMNKSHSAQWAKYKIYEASSGPTFVLASIMRWKACHVHYLIHSTSTSFHYCRTTYSYRFIWMRWDSCSILSKQFCCSKPKPFFQRTLNAMSSKSSGEMVCKNAKC